MTQPTDYLFHPQQESGQGLHMQESGDAGLSSDMEHKFSDNYTECGLIPADKNSFVKPIPKKELNNAEQPGKTWSHPSGMKCADSHSLKAGEVFAPENSIPPSVTGSENNPEEEADEIIPSTTVTTQEESNAEEAGGDCNTIVTERDTGGKTAKPDGPRPVPRLRGNSRHHRKRAGKMRKFYLLCLVLFSVPDVVGFEVKCFTCVDKDRCPNLMTIYGHNDIALYQRVLNQSFPGCCGIDPPAPQTCVVCCDHDTITIICPEDVTPEEAEDSNGKELKLASTPKPGALQATCGSHGLIPSFALFVIAVSAVIFNICT